MMMAYDDSYRPISYVDHKNIPSDAQGETEALILNKEITSDICEKEDKRLYHTVSMIKINHPKMA